MNRDPVNTAVRKATRQRQFGRDSVCTHCGEGRLPTLIEKNHPGGRAHDPDFTGPLCHNCHDIVTESQRRGAVPMTRQANELDREIARLQSLATFHEDFAAAEDRAAERLERFRDFLDTEWPEWRERWENHK